MGRDDPDREKIVVNCMSNKDYHLEYEKNSIHNNKNKSSRK